jgi:hypothetical protein
MSAPRDTPIVTPSKIPWRINNWAAASKQKLLLGVVCLLNFIFGGSPNPGAHRVHPLKRGCLHWELGGGYQTKLSPQGEGGLHGVILFFGAHSNPEPAGSTPPNGDICFWAIILKLGRCSLFHWATMIGSLPPIPPRPAHISTHHVQIFFALVP